MSFEQFHASSAEAIYALCRVLFGTLIASTLVALFAFALFELVKNQLRRRVQQSSLADWTERQPGAENGNVLAAVPDWIGQAVDRLHLGGPATARERLEKALKTSRSANDDPWDDVKATRVQSNELFMRDVQIAAQAAVENPRQYRHAFLRLASFAGEAEVQGILTIGALRDKDPELFAEILRADQSDGAVSGPVAIAIGSGQDSIARSLDRNLDTLQLDIAARWAATSRYAYFALSVLVAIVAPSLELGAKILDPVTVMLMIGIGALGGLVAIALNSFTSMIWTRRAT